MSGSVAVLPVVSDRWRGPRRIQLGWLTRMCTHRLHLFALMLAVLGGVPARGQGNAIRMIFPEFNGVYADQSLFNRWNFGLGYDHEFAHGVSMGIDAVLGGLVLSDDGTTDISYLDHVGTFEVRRGGWSVVYRTSAFTGGGDGGFYMGSFIGVRRARQTYELTYAFSPTTYVSGNGPFEQRTVVDQMVFPIGLRVGVRGPVDGWMSDLYLQLGYQIGSGAPTTPRNYLRSDLRDTNGLVLTLGFAYGVGW